jgi:oxaloacetate decarboxylase
MKHTEQRKKLRAIMAGSKCVSPASVYDALSARVAEAVGYEVGLLAGSVVASTTIAAPDIMVHTATEYADQIRRIMRVSKLSLFVDADNGYGNALNAMRTVEEFEHAGVSGLAVEDTTGPIAYGQPDTSLKLVSIEEGVGKLRAALAARSDPSLVVCARTPAFKLEGMESLLARAKAYAATGVDGIHITGGIKTLEQLKAVHDVFKKPIIMGSTHGGFSAAQLAGVGVRILLQGHQEVAGVVKTLREIYTHLYNGGSTEDLKPRIAPPAEMDQLLNVAGYERCLKEYMR